MAHDNQYATLLLYAGSDDLQTHAAQGKELGAHVSRTYLQLCLAAGKSCVQITDCEPAIRYPSFPIEQSSCMTILPSLCSFFQNVYLTSS